MTNDAVTLEGRNAGNMEGYLQMSPRLQMAMQLNEAIIADDDARTGQMMRQMTLPASVLSALKTGMGADWIRSRGLRTDLADAAFGHGWLDR